MSEITGKTVYVLGAGASHHTGAPLLRDFLVRARLLLDGKENLQYRESFERTFGWINSLRGSSYYVEFDLDNLEHVFSLAEMERQIGLKDSDQKVSDLRRLILETLDRCQLKVEGGQIIPDKIYSMFVENLDLLNQERKDSFGDPSEFERDVIITFNYDVMLDYAMRFRGLNPEYCLPGLSKPREDHFRVLKLHGSANWASCSGAGCAGHLQVLPANPVPPTQGVRVPPKNGTSLNFAMVTKVMSQYACDKCKQNRTLSPIIIPPTWSKMVEGSPISKVWETAVAELNTAFQIVVIGYSMPLTDTFFQYLLTLGLSANSSLHRVVVIDPNDSDEFRQRYEGVFSRSLIERGRLEFLTGITFCDYLRSNISHQGRPDNSGMSSVGTSLSLGGLKGRIMQLAGK